MVAPNIVQCATCTTIPGGPWVKDAFTKQTQYLHLDCLYLVYLRCGLIEVMLPTLIHSFNHSTQNYYWMPNICKVLISEAKGNSKHKDPEAGTKLAHLRNKSQWSGNRKN